MGRFDRGRWNRVVVWTGAALAWGSAFVAAVLQPERDVPAAPDPVPAEAGMGSTAAFPVPPESGIVVIRQSGSAVAPATDSAAPALSPSSAPDPVSSGS